MHARPAAQAGVRTAQCVTFRCGAATCWRLRLTIPGPLPCSLPACLQVVRLSSQDVPTSYAYELEAATIVQPEKVVAAVHKMCGARGLVSA